MLSHGSADVEFSIRLEWNIQLRMIHVSSDITGIEAVGMNGSQRAVTVKFQRYAFMVLIISGEQDRPGHGPAQGCCRHRRQVVAGPGFLCNRARHCHRNTNQFV